MLCGTKRNDKVELPDGAQVPSRFAIGILCNAL